MNIIDLPEVERRQLSSIASFGQINSKPVIWTRCSSQNSNNLNPIEEGPSPGIIIIRENTKKVMHHRIHSSNEIKVNETHDEMVKKMIEPSNSGPSLNIGSISKRSHLLSQKNETAYHQ